MRTRTQASYLPNDLRNRRNLARGGYSSRPVPDLRGQARLRPPFTSFCTAGGDELKPTFKFNKLGLVI